MKQLIALFSLIAFFALAYLPSKAESQVSENSITVICSGSDVGIQREAMEIANYKKQSPGVQKQTQFICPDKIDFGDSRKIKPSEYKLLISIYKQYKKLGKSIFCSAGGMPKL